MKIPTMNETPHQTLIHPTAIVSPHATLGTGVAIGPYCVIGNKVVLKDRVKLRSHICIEGDTVIGEDTEVFPFASIGLPPQDLKFSGEESKLIIGKRNKIREYATLNPGTKGGGLLTQVGDDCLLMIGCHVAHDCRIGNQVILANNATLAGHVTIGDFAIIGGLAAIHQFVRIGTHAMIGGMAGVERDVVPYGVVLGERGFLNGINIIGLKRRGFSNDVISQLKELYTFLFTSVDSRPLRDKVAEYSNKPGISPELKLMIDFVNSQTARQFCMPK